MPDFAYKSSPEAPASPDPTAPLRDWLTTITRREGRAETRPSDARLGETRASEARRAEFEEDRGLGRRVVELPWAKAPEPAHAPSVPEPAAQEPDDVEALIAENMMLRARLRTEDTRYERLQTALADELRSLRGMVGEEADRAEALREERDLWMARAEALAQPLFQRR